MWLVSVRKFGNSEMWECENVWHSSCGAGDCFLYDRPADEVRGTRSRVGTRYLVFMPIEVTSYLGIQYNNLWNIRNTSTVVVPTVMK